MSCCLPDDALDTIDDLIDHLLLALKFIEKPQWTACCGDGAGGDCFGCDRCQLVRCIKLALRRGVKVFGPTTATSTTEIN